MKNTVQNNLNKIQKEIDSRNALFKNANLQQKRILIAKDALQQSIKKKIKIVPGKWVDLHFKNNSMIDYSDSDQSLRELLLSDKLKPCECCGLGGLFVSCTLFNNKTTYGDVTSGDEEYLGDPIQDDITLSNKLNEIFTKNQLILIEIAFEGNDGYFADDLYYHFEDTNKPYHGISKSLFDKALDFYKKYPNDTKRFQAIMRNIIKNNGTFVP